MLRNSLLLLLLATTAGCELFESESDGVKVRTDKDTYTVGDVASARIFNDTEQTIYIHHPSTSWVLEQKDSGEWTVADFGMRGLTVVTQEMLPIEAGRSVLVVVPIREQPSGRSDLYRISLALSDDEMASLPEHERASNPFRIDPAP